MKNPKKLDRNTIIALSILLIWIVPQLLVKQYLAALILLLAIPALFIHKNYLREIALVLVLAVGLLGTQIPDALIAIRNTFQANLSSPSIISTIFTPGSGKSVLPEDAQNVLTMIDDHQLQTYGLSPEIQKNALDQQRIVESAWPVKFEKISRNVFIFADEISEFGTCKQLDQIGSVVLVECD